MRISRAPINAVITGATGGVGRAIANVLALRGMRLCLTGRSQDALEELSENLRSGPSSEIHVHACDFSRPGWLPGLRDKVAEVMGQGVDVLINNAGLGYHCEISSIDPDELEETFRVNVFAPILLTSALLPLLRQSGRGHVVNISSILGTKSMPFTATYAASKHAIEGFSKTLRLETAPDVRVTLIEPGAIETGFLDRTHEANAVQAFGARELRRLPPETVADWVWMAISAEPAVCPEIIRVCPAEQTL